MASDLQDKFLFVRIRIIFYHITKLNQYDEILPYLQEREIIESKLYFRANNYSRYLTKIYNLQH